MPLYEYVCQDCEIKFEVLRALTKSDGTTACPSCRSHKVKRAISRFSAFSRGPEASQPIGGSRCTSCSATTCSTCK